MKLNRYINNCFGCSFPEEFTEEAIVEFSKLHGLTERCLDEAREAKYEIEGSEILRGKLTAPNGLRDMKWSFTVAAYRYVKERDLPVDELSMGIIKSNTRRNIPNYRMEFDRVMSVTADKKYYRAERGYCTYVASTRSLLAVDHKKMKENVYDTLSVLSKSPEIVRFDPQEMGEAEGGYLSYYYVIQIGKIRFVIYTTEFGFDPLVLLRSALRDKPAEATELLGEYDAAF